jgi:short-subunit dehydrogenase
VVKFLSESLAYELRQKNADHISVHLLIPGYTFTGRTRRGDPNKPKPAGAWTAEQVAQKLLTDMTKSRFYILCPDNDVTNEIDHARILYSAHDIIENRSALSRWDPKYADEIDNWMKAKH